MHQKGNKRQRIQITEGLLLQNGRKLVEQGVPVALEIMIVKMILRNRALSFPFLIHSRRDTKFD